MTAQAAGMSRITLHRIEAGEPSVTIGAYFNAMSALGIDIGIASPSWPEHELLQHDHDHALTPNQIHLADYPQLRQLAWHVHGTQELTPIEALNIYDRNWRHIEEDQLLPNEKELIQTLRHLATEKSPH
jgi:transcriptional regulator with XRE-family HTH domain